MESSIDSSLRKFIENSVEGYFILFTPTKPLPHGTSLTITIGPNIPSAEGSLVNEHERVFEVTTVDPFEVTSKSFRFI